MNIIPVDDSAKLPEYAWVHTTEAKVEPEFTLRKGKTYPAAVEA